MSTPSSSPVDTPETRFLDPDALTWDDRGLVPVVAQDVATGAVLMVAWADREAIERTNATGRAHFWSRSREALWKKGETSGNELVVVGAVADCDADTVLLRVHPLGPACHRGTRTCFEPNPARLELGWLAEVLSARRGADPQESYTARLLAGGAATAGKKLGEEAVETVIAALQAEAAGANDDHADTDTSADTKTDTDTDTAPAPRDSLAWEAADLLYHLLVVLEGQGVDPRRLAEELARRHGAPGTMSSTATETTETTEMEETP